MKERAESIPFTRGSALHVGGLHDLDGQTTGEAVFVRPAMAAVGLEGCYSRLPSRDAAVTPEIRDAFQRLLTEVRGTATHGNLSERVASV